MKVLKFKKITKGRYKITFDTGDEYNLYEEVIFKHELLLKKEVDLSKLESILKDNEYYEAYNLALSYIEYKLRSSTEIRKYLERKDYSNDLIDKIINELYKNNYINDLNYVKSFIADKLLLSYDGPYKIKNTLLNTGIEESIINDELNKIEDIIFEEKIKKIVSKRRKLNKKPNSIFISKTYEYLLNLGYEKEMIASFIYEKNDTSNEEEMILKEKEKLYKKYSKKYSDNALDYQIKSALYRKGYSSEIINKVMEQ